MRERYSIQVTDEVVEIYGDLTIEEAFDFLSFFERKGYKSVILGSENSTLRMMKRDQEEEIEKEYIINLKDEIEDYKRSYKIEQERHDETKDKLIQVEKLLKDLMSEEYAKYKALYCENQKLIRDQMVSQLQENPEVKQILDNFGCEPPEKQEQYEKLVQLKNDFPHIPIPSPSDYYINPHSTKE